MDARLTFASESAMTDERTTIFGGRAAPTERTEDHGGRLVAQALKRHGVEVMFTLCGGHVLPILDGCLEEGIRVIDARHEQAAVVMAEGFAYATRTTGVAAVTAGPGFTNAVTGMADANASGVPVVVLSGRTPVKTWKRGAIQDVDQLAIARPVSKWAHTCFQADRLSEHVADAMWHARAGRPGVAYLELPTDVLMATPSVDLPWNPGYPATVPAPAAAPDAVGAALDALSGAERPVAIVGSGAYWGSADEALARFSEVTGIPVTTTGPSRGLLPDSHPGCIGGLAHGGVAVLSADVVLLLGSRFDGNMLFGGPPLFQPWQRIIQVDLRAEAFGGNRIPDLAVHGDAGSVLTQIADGWDTPPKKEWLAEASDYSRSSLESWDAQWRTHGHDGGIHPGWLAREVNAFAQEISEGRCTLVVDGGDILTWGIAYFEAHAPGRIMTTGTALGTLGLGFPFAVAAKAARPDEPVFLLCGDGTFGFSAMELDTAARHGLPIVCIVSNNGAWVDVQYEQKQWFGADRLIASDIGFRRYDKLADMVDGYGAWVTDPGELRPALRAAVDSGRPAVINVKTDPEVLSEILKGIGQLGVM